ncbi:MAG: metallophosphoesterase [Clostridia bacterium]|nr:metallophosphoesterase [Clostridia bacterium]
MAIYVTGDTHGAQRHGMYSVDGYMQRLSVSAFPEQKTLTKDDFVVIMGDFGGAWMVNRDRCEELPSEKHDLDWLEGRPFTTLFVPGNHENYDRLTGCEDEDLLGGWMFRRMDEAEKEKYRQGYPRVLWHGGYVRQLRPSVLMLERGEFFTLGDKTCFAFGGARSHDIGDGILNPVDFETEEVFKESYRDWQDMRRSFRVLGTSWWRQEMPSGEEMNRARDNIQQFLKSHDQVDFIFTHDCPTSDKVFLGFSEQDELNGFLEEVRVKLPHHDWFFGHYHDNRSLMDHHFLLYEQIVRIA